MRKQLLRTCVVCLVFSLAAAACSAVHEQSQPSPTATATVPPTATSEPSLTPTPGCVETAGSTKQIKIHSSTLEDSFTFTVYLPPCYEANHTGGYPVLYLFHGQNMDDTFWPSIGVTQAADQAIVAGKPAFIMVFPYEARNWDPPSESKFGDAVVKDLIPYIESNYSICKVRQCQAIGGLSRGGGWAMHIGLTHFDQFGSIGAHSMGYFSGDMGRIETLLTTHTKADFPRIYMDRGDQDYLRASIDQYEQNLTYAGVAHEYVINPGLHEKAYWQSQVQNYIRWYEEGFSQISK